MLRLGLGCSSRLDIDLRICLARLREMYCSELYVALDAVSIVYVVSVCA